MSNLIICPICGAQIKRGNWHHIKECIDTYVKSLPPEKISDLKHLYKDEGYSMVEMSDYLGFKYNITEKILKRLGLERRSIKDATKQQRCRNKYKQTCLERFGYEHNFCKNSPSRKIWEKRLFDEEGIVNVFQRDSVKKKIIETLIKNYGENFKEVINSKSHIIYTYIKQGFSEKEAEAKYQDLSQKRISYILNGDFISSLSYQFEKYLQEFNIQYEMEFKITSEFGNRYYDFKIDNYLIELNGDFWHANPKKYVADDLLPMPKNKIKASDIWERDALKRKIAQDNGYTFITLWECDLHDAKKILKIKNIMKLYAIRQNKINQKSTSS